MVLAPKRTKGKTMMTMTMNVYEQVSQAVEAGENGGMADVRVLPHQWGEAHDAARQILRPKEDHLRMSQHGINHPLTDQPATLFMVVDTEHPEPDGREEVDFHLFLSVLPHEEH